MTLPNGTRLIQQGTLFVGASLYLYDAKPQADTSRTVESKPESYVVQSGDSLTNLAARFDLSLKQLADYNNLCNGRLVCRAKTHIG